MPRKIEGPSQESKSRQTLSYGGDKAKWEAEQVMANLPDSPKVIAYALLSPVELEDYHPEGEETGFVEKNKYQRTEKRTPTLRLELNKERKTKDGDDGKESPSIMAEREGAKKKLRAFLKTESKTWEELKKEEDKLGDKDSAGLEEDKAFVIHRMAQVAGLFIQFGEEYHGKLKSDIDQLYLEICRREGVADELATKAWAKALNERRVARPKTKKASSIR